MGDTSSQRKHYEYIGRTVMQLSNEIEVLNDENAKLREMVAEMYPYAKAFLQQGVMLGCNDSKSYDWFLQLRKMGIEVE